MRFVLLVVLVLGTILSTFSATGTVGYDKSTFRIAPTNLAVRADSVTAKITNASLYSVSSILKGDGLGGSVAATAGVDYAAPGSASVSVNGASVSNPNFTNSSTATLSVSSTNVSIYPTNIANAQVASGAAIDISKLSGAAPTASPTFTGTVTAPTAAIATLTVGAETITNSITLLNATASRSAIIAADQTVTNSVTTATELGYVNGVTSGIQGQLDLKSPIASPTFTGTITVPTAAIATETVGTLTVTNSAKLLNATASMAAIIGADQTVTNSAVTATEIGYVSGVTSAIQTQLGNQIISIICFAVSLTSLIYALSTIRRKHGALRIALFFALASTAEAQTTNVTISILVEEPTRTNTLVITASPRQVQGFNVDWEKQIMLANQQTNTPPTFRAAVKNTLQDQIKVLAEQAISDERRKAKVDTLLTTIGSNYDSLSNAQKQALKDMATSLGL